MVLNSLPMPQNVFLVAQKVPLKDIYWLLEPWTWLRLEAREAVMEIARRVERKKMDEKTAMEKDREEEARLVEIMIDMENEKKIEEVTKEEKIPDKKTKEVKVTTKKPQDLKKTKQQDIRTVMTEMDRKRRRLERIEKGKKKRDELLCELERRKKLRKPEENCLATFHLKMWDEIERIDEGE